MRILVCLIALAVLAGCATTQRDDTPVDEGIDPNAEADELERQAYEVTGDIRVFYYVKQMQVPSAREKGTFVDQEEQLYILINKSHAWYASVPDYKWATQERSLNNADTYDLLYVLRELGFFDTGHSVNILSDDPLDRADRERDTMRVIAVEQIKDGKVNTSYFARHIGDNTVDADRDPGRHARSVAFNECQAIVMQAIAGTLPRGTAEYGRGSRDRIRRQR
jgi:hypothetical protein